MLDLTIGHVMIVNHLTILTRRIYYENHRIVEWARIFASLPRLATFLHYPAHFRRFS